MHNIRINPLALKDLQEIKKYITEELESPAAAMNVRRYASEISVRRAIRKAIASHAINPYRPLESCKAGMV